MKVGVYVRDKEVRTVLFAGTTGMLFSKAIEIKSDGTLKPFLLLGERGNNFKINARSDRSDHLQCIIKRKKKNISFQFPMLKIGKERIRYVGNDIKSGKFTSSPWTVTVTLKKLGD